MSTHNIHFQDNFLEDLFTGVIGRSSYFKNEFESAMINQPSMVEVLRFDCVHMLFSMEWENRMF